MEPNSEINKTYLFFFLKFFENELKTLRSGTDDRHVDKQALLDFLITCPPPEEQTRIAQVFSWFDDLIENKKKQNEILEKMAIFKSWFIDFEPFQDEEFIYNEELDMEIPKGWTIGKIKDIAEVIMGQSPPSKYYNQEGRGQPFIQGKGQFGRYTPHTDSYSILISKLAKPLDLLVTVRAPVGELNIADKEYVIGRGVAALRSEFWTYLYTYLKMYNDVLKSFERGTTFDAITKPELEDINILLPPQPILQKFHSLFEPLFQKIILNQKEILILKKIRDALLSEEFLRELENLEYKSLAVDLLLKILHDRIRAKMKINPWKFKSLYELLNDLIEKHNTKIIEVSEMISRLVEIASCL